MVAAANSLDLGLADSTPLTTGNSAAGGDAFTTCNQGAGATNAASTAQAAHGSESCKLIIPATAGITAYNEWGSATLGTNPGQCWFRMYFYVTAYPAVNQRIVQLRTAALALAGAVYLRTSTGVIHMADSGNTARAVGSVAVPLSAWCRLEGWLIPSTSSAGSVGWQWWSGASMDSTGTPGDAVSSAASFNTGADCSDISFGFTPNAVIAYTMWTAAVAFSSTGPAGPAAGAPVPEPAAIRQAVKRAAYY